MLCCIQSATVVAEKLHVIDPKVNEGGVKVLAEGFEDVVAGCADDAFMCLPSSVCACAHKCRARYLATRTSMFNSSKGELWKVKPDGTKEQVAGSGDNWGSTRLMASVGDYLCIFTEEGIQRVSISLYACTQCLAGVTVVQGHGRSRNSEQQFSGR